MASITRAPTFAFAMLAAVLISALPAPVTGDTVPLVVSTTDVDVSPETVDMARPVVAVADVRPRRRRTADAAAWPPARPSGTAVLWTATGGGARLTLLDADGQLVGPPLPLPGTSGHALAATPRGFAALLRRMPAAADLPAELWLVEVDRTGSVVRERRLVGGTPTTVVGAEYVDSTFNLDRARLLWTRHGFAAYFMLWRRWDEMNPPQAGDTLRLFDRRGERRSGGFEWGLSHSLDLRLANSGAAIAAVGVSDCFPHKAILWSITGSVLSPEPSGNCAGSSSARLGGLVSGKARSDPAAAFWLTYVSSSEHPTPDVALLRLGRTGTVLSKEWLTNDAALESAPHLAWIRVGSEPRPLIGWRKEDGTHVLLVHGATPQPIAEPFAPTEDFVTYPDGSVGWVWAWAGTDRLRAVRVRAEP
jgi:hypothetical protein